MNQTAESRSILARFASAAQTYHEESGLQRSVAQKLASSMLPGDEVEKILEIGCGTGALTELLRRRFRVAEIHALDIARPMIEMAGERLGECGRIRWHVADARRFSPDKDFSLIVSSSALHWMTPLSETVKRLANMLEPGGELVAAVMVKGTFEELRAARLCLCPKKPPPVDLPSSEEIFEAITGAGLKTESHRDEVLRVWYDSAGNFFRSLNRQGVTGVSNGNGRLLNRTDLRKLLNYYDRQFAVPTGGIFATCRVLYVKARKVK